MGEAAEIDDHDVPAPQLDITPRHEMVQLPRHRLAVGADPRRELVVGWRRADQYARAVVNAGDGKAGKLVADAVARIERDQLEDAVGEPSRLAGQDAGAAGA